MAATVSTSHYLTPPHITSTVHPPNTTPPQNISKHYARLLRLWPADALRPITFHRATLLRLQQTPIASTTTPTFSTPSEPPVSPTEPTSPLTLAPHLIKSGSVPSPSAQSGTHGTLGRSSDEAQINALYSLLENRYSSMYPTSPEMLRPQSKPEYYEDLAAEMEAAPKRGWWAQKMLRLRGMIRLN